MARGHATSCSTSFHEFSPDARRHSPSASSTSAGSTRRCGPASAAARSAPTRVPSVHPYVMLNYTGRRRDVLTLAHELGHGLHAALAQPRGILEQHTPLTLARDRVGVRRDARLPPPARRAPTRRRSRLALLAENIEGSIATVFRQIGDEPLRGPRPHRPARGGRAAASSASASCGHAVAGRAARRRGRDHRGLPHVVVLRAALHRHARLRLRLRLRPAARAVASTRRYLEEGEAFVPALPRAAERRRLAQPRGAGRDRRPRPRRPGVLGRTASKLVRDQLERPRRPPRRSRPQPEPLETATAGGRARRGSTASAPSGAGQAAALGRTSTGSRRSRARTHA